MTSGEDAAPGTGVRLDVAEMQASTVLVVEDERELRELIVEALEKEGFAVAQAETGADATARLRGFAYDGLIIDLGLPDANGMDILEDALGRYPELRAIVITGIGGIEEAVRAIRRGAVDFLIKPFQVMQPVSVLKTAINERRLRRENAELRAQLQDRFRFDAIIGTSRPMMQVFSTLELVAPMHSAVLIQGETGTGKELIARSIHFNSPRRDFPFVAFNAGAIPEGLAEAELFGHVKGAFTGAIANRMGRFELADRGTLFIDEVSSMSMALQAKLLRALQEREIEKVGTSRPIKINARVIAATNVDLLKLVKDGGFREDLYYRLNVVRVALPPLRARQEDIPMLAQRFARQSAQHNNLPARAISQEAMRLLMRYDWPGNIRQLENAVEHAVAMSGTRTDILPEMLPEELHQPDRARTVPSVTIPDEGVDFSSIMSQMERDLILQCLQKTGGNKRQAAKLLSLSRTTLIDKLQRLGIGDPSAA